MQDREHRNEPGFDAVEDREGKARDNCTTNLSMNACEDLGKTRYGVKCSVDFPKKLFAKAIALSVVPRVTPAKSRPTLRR